MAPCSLSQPLQDSRSQIDIKKLCKLSLSSCVTNYIHVFLSTAWKSITSGDFTVRMFDGSHFYLKDSANEKIILDFVTKQLETSEMDYL